MRLKKHWLGLAITGLLLLTGCSTQLSADDGSSSNAQASDADTLIIARLSDAENLDHQFMSTINAASVTHGKVYEGLVGRDKSSEFVPLLAESWKQISDTVWEFSLREDVTFHDGEPFTAEAVKKTFERLLDPNVGSPRAGALSMVQEIKAVDDHTVQFILTEPYAPLLSILAGHESGIISPKAIERFGKELINEPVGTGPFRFEHWKPGQEIVLVRNEEYWGSASKLAKVIFKVVPEETTRVSMIETGEAHVTEPLSVTMMETVENSQSSNLYRSESYGTEYLGFNVSKQPFDNVLLRKAVAHAIEVDSIRKGVFNNVGGVANSLLGSKVFGYDDTMQPYSYNLDEAKRLMAEAGYKDGLTIKLTTMDSKERINLAEVVQSQLKGIGITVEIEVLEYGTFVDTTNSGNTEMYILSWRNATGDADYNQFNLLHSSTHGPGGNRFFYADPQVDEWIEQARQEMDSDKRGELYSKAQHKQMEDALYIPVRVIENMAAVHKDVKGFDITPAGYIDLSTTRINN
ncbi:MULTISPECIES: glutathione ABC transporter substrate-binding protein [Psychrobacillus]|uniref:Glutathione ABC transporter substrate-binding protein n=1 Tax=Psychrobacillus lasiicapitis TaxID=1636719 RepID=A0A544TC04_9BACI|nr:MULTISPECIES: glutathione ABC transporter substrate-binding protein [Psychrobacillus]MDI2587808.1 glutathione ABC transporter substrate-binding protein [Psychrobacillus sp. NEAU-3TGS]TQR15003.1 glutathione ABC transporter substrate-binding protein [Psychrobacillus lasiicapitis]GGA21680.1 glutathione ABC transporter substrate-binding protein [Psychrobacillus lasiicapitis]